MNKLIRLISYFTCHKEDNVNENSTVLNKKYRRNEPTSSTFCNLGALRNNNSAGDEEKFKTKVQCTSVRNNNIIKISV